MTRAILLVDHGSRHAAANATLHSMARLVQQQADGALIVRPAHLELASPTIADGFASCVLAGALEIIVHPYMLAPGRHATEDIPRQVAAAAAEHPTVRWRMTDPIGVHPLVARVVLERCGITPSSGPTDTADSD